MRDERNLRDFSEIFCEIFMDLVVSVWETLRVEEVNER